MFVVEDGTGLANANSYLSLAEANDFFTLNANSGSWADFTDDQKQAGLATATRYIDVSYTYLGEVRNRDQKLVFPRRFPYRTFYGTNIRWHQVNNTVPQDIKDATCVLALSVITNNRLESVDASTNSNIQSIAVDTIRIAYRNEATAATADETAQATSFVTVSAYNFLKPFINAVVFRRLDN